MKNKKPSPLLTFTYLIVAIVGTWAILQYQSDKIPGLQKSASKLVEDESRGPHRGWLFAKDNLKLELAIFEKGVPPQFRVYVTDKNGKPVDLKSVRVKVELERLHKNETVNFFPAGEYLLGDQTVYEPHSFHIKITATHGGKTYSWKISQIEARAVMAPAAVKTAGIGVGEVGPATLTRTVPLLGEVTLNRTRVAHIAPRLNGVVLEVLKHTGEPVVKGDLVAVLESRELADAKTRFVVAKNKSDLAKIEFQRAKAVSKNTLHLLDLLRRGLDQDSFESQGAQDAIGEHRASLISAYAKFNLAKSVYEREQNLYEKKISSKSEYLQAEETLKSTEAQYISQREKIAYQVERDRLEKDKANRLEKLHLETSRQKLLTIGIPPSEIEALSLGREQNFTRYEIHAPIDGVLIQKHMTVGEAVKKADTIFTIADLSTVWVNITIPEKDLNKARIGQTLRVSSETLGLESTGLLTFIEPTMDEQTRSVMGRMVLRNPKGHWRPGMFVTIEIIHESLKAPIAVPVSAIQTLRGWTVVFVKYGDAFEARLVELGDKDSQWAQVSDGLTAGETIVVKNSFAVKAEIEKSQATHDH